MHTQRGPLSYVHSRSFFLALVQAIFSLMLVNRVCGNNMEENATSIAPLQADWTVSNITRVTTTSIELNSFTSHGITVGPVVAIVAVSHLWDVAG